MKKYIIILAVAVVFFAVGGYMIRNILSPGVNIPDANAVLNFVYSDKNINVTLNEEESTTIKDMFDRKRLYKDNLACGFTESVSISFDGMVFCVACDMCPIIKFDNKFFRISEKDREILNLIFEKYGGFFPCV